MTTQPPAPSTPPGPPQDRPSGPPQSGPRPQSQDRPSGPRNRDPAHRMIGRQAHVHPTRDGRVEVAGLAGPVDGISHVDGGFALASRARRSTIRTSTSSDASSPIRPRWNPAGRRACAPSASDRSPAPSSARATSPCCPTRDTIEPVERVPSASAYSSGALVRRAGNRPRPRRELAFHLCRSRSRRLPRNAGCH